MWLFPSALTLPNVGGWGRDAFFLTGAHGSSIPLLQLAEGHQRGAAPFGFKVVMGLNKKIVKDAATRQDSVVTRHLHERRRHGRNQPAEGTMYRAPTGREWGRKKKEAGQVVPPPCSPFGDVRPA